MKQLQAINDLFLNSKADDDIPLEFFFASKVPPRWVLRKELCNSYIKLGLAKAALDEFLGENIYFNQINLNSSLSFGNV